MRASHWTGGERRRRAGRRNSLGPPSFSSRARLYGGCAPEGTCTYSGANSCFSNGVIATNSTPGGPTAQTITKDGVVCATLDATRVYRDPSGGALGTLKVNADGTTTYTCTGEAPVTVPASCTIGCSGGKCPP